MNKNLVSLAETREFSSASGDLFGGFFAPGKDFTFPRTGLVDSRARGVFELVNSACEAGLYPYQVALDSRTGPWAESEGREVLLLSSYDYLGLIGDPRIDNAAIEAIRKYGTGTGGARLLSGTIDLHRHAEIELAAFKGTAEAITFSSGYLANLAAIAGLLTPQDRVLLDSLSHRSLVDACRMAGVQLQRFRHNDMESLRQELLTSPTRGRTLIVADGVFSMDGDICPLPELIEMKREFECFLMIDDAHAFGVIGEHGRGTDEHFGCDTNDVDIWTGSLGKSIPATGGFLACSQQIAIYIQHAAAPFIFSGALNPSAAAVILETVSILRNEPERVRRLAANATFFRDGLRELGFDVGLSETAIIPVILPDEPTAAIYTRRLRDLGVLATPIMFPAVAHGSARLRLCVTAAHTIENLEFALDAFRQLR
jgi:8-amino-7-oxononanoate synthase